ncbi:MAG: enoyl-CoA hydratase [Hyphomicrobiaceae bacterium]
MSEISSEEKLIGRHAGHVGHLIFNNPAKLNAVSLDMWEKAFTVLEGFATNPDIRAVVVSGTGGRAFVSGADISKFESERASEEAATKYNATSLKAYEALYYFPKPTIAKITGYCIGGGMNLAACCDLRFCNEAAKFGVPAAKLGLGYGFAPIRRAAEIIGLSRAMEMIYTARQFTAKEAYDIGLVNRVLPDGELDDVVAETCAQIAGNAPLTIALAKASAREIGKPESERDLAKLTAMSKACFDSADYAEGRKAFMEKRKPKFEGK